MMKKLLLSLILVLAVTPVSAANRLKTWIAETLTFADLNAEWNNVYIGTIDRTAGRWGANDDIPLTFGTSQDARLEWDTAQTTDSVLFGLGAGNIFSIMELADMTTDWGIASQINPTLFVHSADATATTDHISISHDQTNGVIRVGSGVLNITADILLSGTTPLLTIGDSGVEDTTLIFTTNAQTFYLCGDDGTDSLILGLGSTCGANPSLTFTSDGTEDMTLAGDLTVSGTGPHAIGTSVLDYVRHRFGGNFTSGGASTNANGILVDGTITGASGDTSYITAMEIGPVITTQNAGDTIVHVSTLRLQETNLTANDTVTNSSILHLSGPAATEATNDYGLLVETANARFGAVGTNDGHLHILSPSTSTVALVVEMPSSAGESVQAWHLAGTQYAAFFIGATQVNMELNARDLGNDNAGPLFTAGRNTNGSTEGPAPGAIMLEQADGGDSFIWVENDLTLKIHTAAATGSTGTPTVDENAGTVVGAQTSPEFLKNILYRYSNEPNDRAYEKFQAVLDTPIKDFNFKSGKHYGQTFTGIAIPDGEHPWYGMDTVKSQNDIAPMGTAKHLNELSIPGYLILSIKVLNRKITRLENEIHRLHSRITVAAN